MCTFFIFIYIYVCFFLYFIYICNSEKEKLAIHITEAESRCYFPFYSRIAWRLNSLEWTSIVITVSCQGKMSYVVRQVCNSFYSTRYMRNLFSWARHRTPKGTPIDQLRENETWIENDLHSLTVSFSLYLHTFNYHVLFFSKKRKKRNKEK